MVLEDIRPCLIGIGSEPMGDSREGMKVSIFGLVACFSCAQGQSC